MTYGIGSQELTLAETASGVAHAVPPERRLHERVRPLCDTTDVQVARGTWPPRDNGHVVEACNVCAELADVPMAQHARELARAARPDIIASGLAEFIAHVLGAGPVASPLAPALGLTIRALREADRRMWRQVAQAIAIATDELDGAADIEKLASQDAARTELLRRVVQAAGHSTLEEKIPALGRVLAAGLPQGDRVDEALILAAALHDLEAPHVHVLATIAFEEPDEDEIRQPSSGWMLWMLERRHPGHRAVMTPILRILELHGLVVDVALGTWNGAGGRSMYGVSEAGRRCLELLSAGA